MKAIISETALAAADTDDVWMLHRLLGYACEGRHLVCFDPPSSADKWFDFLDAPTSLRYKRAIELAARHWAMLPADSATVRVEFNVEPRWDDPLAVLPLSEAIDLLNEPLGVVVENAANDWFFLCGLMRPSERQRVMRYVERGWLTPIHGGGATLPKQLGRRLERPAQALRTFLFFDSDRRHPSELDPSWHPTGSEACQGYEVEKIARPHFPEKYWMLKRRFIESYIPKSCLFGPMPQHVHANAPAAFLRLTQFERWYYNMKTGFNGDSPTENKHRCRELFADTNNEDREALQRGFGSSLADCYSAAIEKELDWDTDALQEASEALPRLMRLL